MAVYRQVHVSFWQDPFVLDLTPEEKYFYLYLMTNSKTTQCGIYEIPYKIMETETGYNRETVDKLINRFKDYGKILHSPQTREIMVLNWLKYNSIKSPKVRACVVKELRTTKNQEFVSLFKTRAGEYGYSIEPTVSDKEKENETPVSIDYEYSMDTVSIQYPKSTDRLDIDSGEEKEKEKEKEQEKEEEQEKEIKGVPIEDIAPLYPLSGAVSRLPEIQRPSAALFSTLTKRELSEDDCLCLGLLFKIHTPAAIQKELIKAFERLQKNGSITLMDSGGGEERVVTDRRDLPMRYIYNSMKNWSSLKGVGAGGKPGGNAANTAREHKNFSKGSEDLFTRRSENL